MTNDSTGDNEFRSTITTRDARVTLIQSGATKNLLCSQANDADGILELLFEGDIVIDRPTEKFGVAITGARCRWTKRTVVYDIHPKMPNHERVELAIKHWQEKTPIRFKVRSIEPDYVIFRPGAGCSSAVGRVGGVQFITLGPNCTLGNTIHEIGHTVGLWHEQSREDRDHYIDIMWNNIDPAMAHNFNQHIADGDDLGDYDYGSIMHYPANAFALDPSKPTIRSKQAGMFIGQRQGLSLGDIAAVLSIYP
jgi:hypothetical protein